MVSNLYSTEREDIEAHAPQIAEVFAAHDAVTLGKVQELNQLQHAVESRQAIGYAVRILMERYHLDEKRAFASWSGFRPEQHQAPRDRGGRGG